MSKMEPNDVKPPVSVSLPCLVCHKPLTDVMAGATRNQPAKATTFVAYGQYGSTVFDPVSEAERSYLEINICDPCLVEAAGRNHVLECETVTVPRHYAKPWKP